MNYRPLATLLIASFAIAAVAPAQSTAPATSPSIEIMVDTKAAPEMTDFAMKMADAGSAYYAKIAQILPSDKFTPAHKVWLTFRRDKKPFVAYTMNDHVFCDPDYYTKNPNDLGSFIHELTHVVQAYRLRPPPSWITEGIADWVRWYHYEPANHRPHPSRKNAKYDGSYQTSAAFFNWVSTTYDPQFVVKLNAVCRAGHYHKEVWKELTGKTVEELGDQWKQSIPGPATRRS